MINLNKYMNRSIDFMIGKRLIKVNEPSFMIMKEFETINNQGIEGLNNLVLKIMNNNSSGVEFTLSEIESWNKSTINAIIQAIADEKSVTENDPN